MNRRALLKRLGAVPFAPLLATALAERASAGSGLPGMPYPRRVRPNDAAWPDAAAWESLNRQTGGRLIAADVAVPDLCGFAQRRRLRRRTE